ncbi:hypothetical protein [Nannocystis sp.]|uniref:DUF6918 family protein n=1 Tax=Nannocystis sp. TaxID=1962667 RepID=UPI0024217437|nr:hypothetical protein [Nannocystis sp.]MBK7829849.1 hypothetical protein [Nannocystis sp.]MBK9757745.1 hypothetical protein [Nannocystis sp.]
MANLAEILTQPELRPQVVRACAVLIDSEVASKSGFSGLAVKAGYKLVKTIKPTMVSEVVDRLLPEFAEAMQPMFDEVEQQVAAKGQARSELFSAHMQADPRRVAAALLTVTDRRAEKASGALKKTYARLRDTAEEHVQAAVPGLVRALTPFV